jgi:hypothetical protein
MNKMDWHKPAMTDHPDEHLEAARDYPHGGGRNPTKGQVKRATRLMASRIESRSIQSNKKDLQDKEE